MKMTDSLWSLLVSIRLVVLVHSVSTLNKRFYSLHQARTDRANKSIKLGCFPVDSVKVHHPNAAKSRTMLGDRHNVGGPGRHWGE